MRVFVPHIPYKQYNYICLGVRWHIIISATAYDEKCQQEILSNNDDERKRWPIRAHVNAYCVSGPPFKCSRLRPTNSSQPVASLLAGAERHYGDSSATRHIGDPLGTALQYYNDPFITSKLVIVVESVFPRRPPLRATKPAWRPACTRAPRSYIRTPWRTLNQFGASNN